MENKLNKASAEEVVDKWRKLVRQQSTKIGILADNVVLPKNERTLRRVPIENTEMQNVSTQGEQTEVTVDEQTAVKKVEHFPVFMIGISLVQIILFFSFDEDTLSMKYGFDPYRRHEVWRFVTMMFVHSGFSHLLGNVVMQLILGVFLEIVHQWKRIAIIYLASVIGGVLFITILDNSVYSVGASGGVMGLLFSHLATILLNWNEMDRKFSRCFCIVLYIVYDVGTDLYSDWYIGSQSNISHACHFGGAVTGFLVSILVLKNFKKHAWEDTMQKVCAGILFAIFFIFIVINFSFPDFYPTNEWNFEYEKSYSGDSYDYDNEEVNTELATELYDED